MRLRRSIGDKRRSHAAKPLLAGFRPKRMNLRHDKRREIRHGRAGEEHARRAAGVAQRLGHPSRNLLLDSDADVIAAAAIHIERRRRHLRDHADRRTCAMHPAHEARMTIARRVRNNVRPHIVEHVAKLAPLARQAFRKPLAHLIGRGPPNRLLAYGLDMGDHVVQHRMREASKLAPIARIEIAGIR